LDLTVNVFYPFAEAAFSAEKEKEFEKIKKMDLKELTSEAEAALKKSIPGRIGKNLNSPSMSTFIMLCWPGTRLP
jgi:hypothetical protein